MKVQYVTLAAFAIATPAPASFAQVPQSLAPFVVSAARVEQSIADALPSANVITRADIERSLAPDLLTLLARLPGVEIAQLGGIGSQTGIFLRGAETRHVLVLIDGMPLNNLNFSTASLDQIMAAQVDRVEIVRGNVSSLYGSQAVGGVIQIFTRSGADGTGIDARAGAGSRGTYEAQAGARGGAGGWRFGFTVSGLHTDGFNAIDQSKRPDTNPDRDGYRNASGSGQLSFTWAPEQTIGVQALRTRGRLEFDSEFGPATQADESVQIIESINATARNRIASSWVSQLSVGRLRDDLDARVTAFPFFVTSTGTQIAWQNEIDIAAGWKATLAAEHLRQTIDSDTTYNVDRRTVKVLRAGVLGNSGAHQFQLNLRRDDYSDFGVAGTGYAGYGLALSDTLKLSASASTAFNAPTFNDLFFPFGGNPDLKPERSRAFEAGLQYRKGETTARAQAFYTRFRNLIGSDAAFNRVNIGRATVQGVELSLAVPVGAWRAQLAATLQDARDDQTDARLVRRARAFGNLQISRAVAALELQANVRVTGNRTDRALGAGRVLGGYALVDVAARWRVWRDLRLTLRAENLFDHAFENAFGYRSTPRGVFGGIEWHL